MSNSLPKMTTAQKDAFYGFYKQRDFRRKPDGSLTRVMGGAYKRMMDNMRSAGLIYDYSRHQDKLGKPREINTQTPSALGIRAWLFDDPRAKEFPDLEAQADRLTQIEREWNAAVEKKRKEDNAANDARIERQRAERVKAVRIMFGKLGLKEFADSKSDEDIEHAAYQIGHAYDFPEHTNKLNQEEDDDI